MIALPWLRPLGWLFAIFAALLAVTAPAQTFPTVKTPVVDDAHLLSPDASLQLQDKLVTLRKQSGRSLVVVTIPSLQGFDIEEFGNGLYRAAGIGGKAANEGVLLLVAPTERKISIEVGYGAEGIVTDALASVIINTQIRPRFKAGDFAGGINAGVDALIRQLQLPPDEARRIAQNAGATQARNRGEPRFGIGTVVFLGVFVLFFVLPFLRSMRGGQRYGSRGVRVYPGGGFGSSFGGGFLGSVAGNLAANAIERGFRGDSGGGWSGSNDGGGGADFSDFFGGGSSGGGGASGDW